MDSTTMTTTTKKQKCTQYHIDSLHHILLLPCKQSLVSFLLNVRLVLVNLHAVKSYCRVGGCIFVVSVVLRFSPL